MWTYWCLVEGTLGVDPSYLLDNDGNLPPVVHLDTDAALLDDTDGSLVTEELWGIYYKPDFNFGGVQGGAMPWVVEQPADEVAVDPYGADSTEFIVGQAEQKHFRASFPLGTGPKPYEIWHSGYYPVVWTNKRMS